MMMAVLGVMALLAMEHCDGSLGMISQLFDQPLKIPTRRSLELNVPVSMNGRP